MKTQQTIEIFALSLGRFVVHEFQQTTVSATCFDWVFFFYLHDVRGHYAFTNSANFFVLCGVYAFACVCVGVRACVCCFFCNFFLFIFLFVLEMPLARIVNVTEFAFIPIHFDFICGTRMSLIWFERTYTHNHRPSWMLCLFFSGHNKSISSKGITYISQWQKKSLQYFLLFLLRYSVAPNRNRNEVPNPFAV